VHRGRRRPHVTRGIAINMVADCRSDASALVLARLRRRIEPGSLPGVPDETPQRCIGTHIWVRFASLLTARSLCVVPLEQGPDAFYDIGDALRATCPPFDLLLLISLPSLPLGGKKNLF
jgi:hypothetical protein